MASKTEPLESTPALLLDGADAAAQVERLSGAAAVLPRAARHTAAAHFAARWRASSPGDASVQDLVLDSTGVLAAQAGLALTGQRSTGFLPGQALLGAGSLMSSLAGMNLPLLLHVAAEGAPRAGQTRHAGHESYHAAPDAPWLRFFAADPQEAAHLTLIARRAAEDLLLPALLAQDAWLGTHALRAVHLPTAETVAAYLGYAAEQVPPATAAQRLLFGESRRRVPARWDLEAPALSGLEQGREAFAQGALAHAALLQVEAGRVVDEAIDAYAALTGQRLPRLAAWDAENAEHLILVQGSAVGVARAVASHLRRSRGLRVGVLSLRTLWPFPAEALAPYLLRRKAVLVMERLLPPHGADGPLLATVRGVLQRCLDNGRHFRKNYPHPELPGIERLELAPTLHGASYGLGGQPLVSAHLAQAVETMADPRQHRRRVALGVDFLRDVAESPVQEIYQQTLADAFPGTKGLGQTGGDPLPLRHRETLALRILEDAEAPLPVAEALGRLLFDLGGLHVTVHPRGAPDDGVAVSTLLVSREPLLAPPSGESPALILAAGLPALGAGRALAGAAARTPLLLDASAMGPEALAALLPTAATPLAVTHLDAGALAAEEGALGAALAPARLAVLLGATLAHPVLQGLTGLKDKALQRAVQAVLVDRNPDALPAELETELVYWRRGIEAKPAELADAEGTPAPDPAALPPVLRHTAPGGAPLLDLQRYWSHLGQAHARGDTAQAIAEPFAASGTLPPGTAALRGAEALRPLPQWLPEACTGCGQCWTVCPDGALPSQVHALRDLLEGAMRQVEADGRPAGRLPRAVRSLEGDWRRRIAQAEPGTAPLDALDGAIAAAVAAAQGDAEQRALGEELHALRDVLAALPTARTAVFFDEAEGRERNGGGLLSIALDTGACKGCGLCVQACPDEALTLTTPAAPERAALAAACALQQDLPPTPEAHLSARGGTEREPGLARLYLDRRAAGTLSGGDHGAPGDVGRTVLRLALGMATAQLRPRRATLQAQVAERIERLETRVRLQLAVDVSDPNALSQAMEGLRGHDFSLAELSAKVDPEQQPVDAAWLARVVQSLHHLKALHARLDEEEDAARHCASGAAIAREGDLAQWLHYPDNPFRVPVVSLDAAHGAALVQGLFEGHLQRMAADFRLLRGVDLELDGRYLEEVHGSWLARFSWRDFSAEEWALCPPLLLVGNSAALSAAALQGLWEGGRPVKVLCLNDGFSLHAAELPGGATAVPEGQEEPAALAQVWAGVAPDPALTALAHRNVVVAQGSLADLPGLLAQLQAGLVAPLPALFDVFRVRPAALDVPGLDAVAQARLALAARVHPALLWNPAQPDGAPPLLAGNPDAAAPWGSTPLRHLDDDGTMTESQMPATPAHLALSLPELAHHFTPVEADDPGTLPLTDYLDLPAEDWAEHRATIQVPDAQGRLALLGVSDALVALCAATATRWRFLRALARDDLEPVDEAAIADAARSGVVDTVWQNLLNLAEGRPLAPASAGTNGGGKGHA